MVTVKTYNHQAPPSNEEKQVLVSFLFKHLDAFGDPAADIEKAINYALKENNTPGGLLLSSWDDDTLTGAVVINKTGMDGYIPENILVYIATHKDYRGKGIGKELMRNAIQHTEGDIALHVEPDNPAKKLYESLGFTNKYLEMRLKKES
jgi:[ribosomal protein S18]-alanine N-acetyltransferase